MHRRTAETTFRIAELIGEMTRPEPVSISIAVAVMAGSLGVAVRLLRGAGLSQEETQKILAIGFRMWRREQLREEGAAIFEAALADPAALENDGLGDAPDADR